MRNLALFMTFVFQISLSAASVSAQSWHEPARGTQERRDLMDAVRPIAEWQLGAPIQFVVQDLRLAGDVAFGALYAQRPGGGPIDLARAPGVLRGDLYAEDVQETIYTVLYKKSGNTWVAVEWTLSAGDPWWIWAPTCAAFRPVIADFCDGL